MCNGVIIMTDGRAPHDLQGLLRLAVENTPDGGGEGERGELEGGEEERLGWLRGALNSLGMDAVQEMAKGIDIMKSGDLMSGDVDTAPYEEILDTLSDYVDNLDYARDFHKVGGFNMLPVCMASPHQAVRWRAANLLAELTQNHPYCQEAAVTGGHLKQVLSLLDEDSDELVRVKAMYAVSSITRDCPSAHAQFELLDGWSVLLRAVQSHITKLRIKACFFMSAMCELVSSVKPTLTDMGLVTQLTALLSTPHESTHEHVVNALLSLVRDNKDAQLECCKPELQLKQLLDSRLSKLAGKEEHLEELSYWTELNNICFIDETQADR